ncbi:hypothetical protein ACJ2A9_02710 [Anaerobacillus sp. MEB173]|uniref:hypothetical protein n=1 Tax=Anaerobacillus sp. MEB173 TaxID=3383345 RepID=UPI003F926B5C
MYQINNYLFSIEGRVITVKENEKEIDTIAYEYSNTNYDEFVAFCEDYIESSRFKKVLLEV